MAALSHSNQQHRPVFSGCSEPRPSCRNADGCGCKHNADIFFYCLNCLACVRSCTVAYVGGISTFISCLLRAGLHPANEVKQSREVDLVRI